MIFALLVSVASLWLMFKVLKLTLKVAWCLAKVVAVILFALSLPALILCLIFAGGVLLLAPLILLVIAFALLQASVV